MEANVREQVIALLAGELDEGIDNLDDLERRAVSLMRDLTQGVVQRKLDDTKKGYRGSRIGCSCGAKARFVGYRRKTVLASVGSVTIQRAYYHCSSCGTGQLPYDQDSGLGPGQLSNALAAAGCLLASQGSFAEAGRTLEALLGIRVDDNQLQQAVPAGRRRGPSSPGSGH